MALSPVQQSVLASHGQALQRLGFNWTLDDMGRLALTQVPVIYADRLQQTDPTQLFSQLLTSLVDNGDVRLETHAGIELMIATLSCHSAVRAGDVLSHGDMEAVVNRWLDCTLPWTCPHGRPIAHTIQREALQQFFHRGSLPVNAG
jgi:DNA mismatch repair protein MutL